MSTEERKKRGPGLYVAAGCATLVACVFIWLVGDGIYWSARMRAARAEQGQVVTTDVQAEWATLPAGSAAAGELVFTGDGTCFACHSLEPEVNQVGPSLAGVGQTAAGRKEGYSAELFLYESIVYPNAHLSEGFKSGIMPADFSEKLTDQQLADVVAFLLTR